MKTRKIPNQQKVWCIFIFILCDLICVSFMFGFAKGDISLTRNMHFNTKSPLYKFGFAVKHLTLHNLSIKQNNFKELNLCEKSWFVFLKGFRELEIKLVQIQGVKTFKLDVPVKTDKIYMMSCSKFWASCPGRRHLALSAPYN